MPRCKLKLPPVLVHVDQVGTHVVSAMIKVGQDVEEDLPFSSKDNRGEKNIVMIQSGPGDHFAKDTEISFMFIQSEGKQDPPRVVTTVI